MPITYRDREWDFDKEVTVLQILKRLKVLPESVLVLRNGKLVSEDQRIQAEHFPEWIVPQTERMIRKYKMFDADARILVAVSGGQR